MSVTDTQVRGRVFELDGKKWIVQQPRDGSAIDWGGGINLLQVDHYFHRPVAVPMFQAATVRQLHDAAPEDEVMVEIEHDRMYRVTVFGQ